jgi:hypothetical protein
MNKLTFAEFYKGNYDELGYELYVVKDIEENVMYIGISQQSIWHRWFGCGTSHMEVGFEGMVYGISTIAKVIERRFPLSWNWTIELFTKEDCLNILKDELIGRNLDGITIKEIEPYMINRFLPLYNATHGGRNQEDPLITKNLDAAYKKIFGNL